MKHEESILQISFLNWLRLQYPKLESFVFHIPNGGRMGIVRGKILKKMGVKSGVADIFVMIPNADFHGLWLEFKSKIGKQTDTQKLFEQNCYEMGYDYHVIRDLKEAQTLLKKYLSRRYEA